MKQCHICDSERTSELTGSDSLKRVTSDCKPMPSGTLLLSCLDCGSLVTDATPEWRRACDDSFSDFEVYAQSSGIEEKTFSIDGVATPRSSVLASLLESRGFTFGGKWLDFGCGNGSFLRQMSGDFPGMTVFGVEYDERHRDTVLGIPGAGGFGTSIDDLGASVFQTISMIHVLQHIENPLSLLTRLVSRLAPGGQLLIQVPHIWTNPYTLTVGDNATYFDLCSLKSLVRFTGLEVAWGIEDFIGGELTLLARKSPVSGVVHSEPLKQALSTVTYGIDNSIRHSELVTSLSVVARWLTEQRESYKVLGIFGSSIAGTWAGSCLEFTHDYWVDEDLTRVGSPWMGREIISPSQVGPEDRVAMVLGPSKADRVIGRLAAADQPIKILKPPLPVSV